ncbi:unnamed protein product [Zymoseptoria tritici ST99CH_1A5]|uniref:Guanine nucleotide exchange factor synembryn n=2 Tax=Zymoseptoria tritici TaxID=1047171 RepID=A0A2H1GBB0_ZYMTR|nr:unnamed protein product [Zymoseptoria tritici ST99CH_1E4]SMY23553.1 unnamed protein product [Zymoseptoria tritici ST99CH_1A5]
MQRQNGGTAGTAEVDRLLLELEKNLEGAKLSLQQQQDLLSQLKVLGRIADNASPIFTKRGITVLSKYGLDRDDAPDTSREALRCLANAFYLNEPCRQTFVDLGYAPKAAERLKVDNRDDEFLVARMLFLLTYKTKIDFGALINQHQLAESINQHIARHAKRFSKPERTSSATSPMHDMSMTETLKLLYNIIHHYPDQGSRFLPSIEPLINIILYFPLQEQPLQPPITSALNALGKLDLQATEPGAKVEQESSVSPLFPQSDPKSVIERLTFILDGAIRHQAEKDIDEAAATLCALLILGYELGTQETKSWMQQLLLPTSEDRERPLGQGNTLASRLLRLSCSPVLPRLRIVISSLLFELSDKDPDRFIKNIGYGFASGFLTSKNIQIPRTAMDSGSTESDGVTGTGFDINPVTGQRLSAERANAPKVKEMTDEEKEREAEKLFVLFERLKATGVMNVQNPVEQAIQEGRFEELDD